MNTPLQLYWWLNPVLKFSCTSTFWLMQRTINLLSPRCELNMHYFTAIIYQTWSDNIPKEIKLISDSLSVNAALVKILIRSTFHLLVGDWLVYGHSMFHLLVHGGLVYGLWGHISKYVSTLRSNWSYVNIYSRFYWSIYLYIFMSQALCLLGCARTLCWDNLKLGCMTLKLSSMFITLKIVMNLVIKLSHSIQIVIYVKNRSFYVYM